MIAPRPTRATGDRIAIERDHRCCGPLERTSCCEPEAKAGALADILGSEMRDNAVAVGETIVRFLPGGPEGRPELHAERFAS